MPNVAVLLATGAVLLVLLLGLRWVARNSGGSTPEGEEFMDRLGAQRSRFIRPGGGR